MHTDSLPARPDLPAPRLTHWQSEQTGKGEDWLSKHVYNITGNITVIFQYHVTVINYRNITVRQKALRTLIQTNACTEWEENKILKGHSKRILDGGTISMGHCTAIVSHRRVAWKTSQRRCPTAERSNHILQRNKGCAEIRFIIEFKSIVGVFQFLLHIHWRQSHYRVPSSKKKMSRRLVVSSTYHHGPTAARRPSTNGLPTAQTQRDHDSLFGPGTVSWKWTGLWDLWKCTSSASYSAKRIRQRTMLGNGCVGAKDRHRSTCKFLDK